MVEVILMTVRMFQDIPSNDGEQTIRQSIAVILERAQELRLVSSKWSLAELQLAAEDYTWLCEWAQNLSGIVTQLWLEVRPWQTFKVGTRECTYSAALGALLLLFTAETARRNATEGFLWSIFQQNCFAASTTRILYVAGQPTRAHKDALEAAARWLNLRHVFGIEGLQNWFDTVYLQFGFTYRGFQRRLPEWLVGQGKTQAMQHLLDGPMKSDTFRTLWESLRNFRRKNIRVEQLKARLASNPWVLPEWTDELLQQATARIEIGEGAQATDTADDVIEPFVTEPILRWNPPEAPKFLCYVSNIAQFELSDPLYYVMINDRVYTQLQRSPDGVYVFYPSEEIVLPATVPILVATLISSTGQAIASNTLILWNTNEDLTVFRAASGKRLDAWKDTMRSEVAYAIITAPDLTLTPSPFSWQKLDVQGTMLSFIDTGWPDSLQVHLTGQILWQPGMKNLTRREEPQWSQSFILELFDTPDRLTFGDILRVVMYHTEDVVVSFIRLNSRPINFSKRDIESTVTDPIMVSPDMLFRESYVAELNFTIGVRNGSISTTVTRTVRIGVTGATMLSQQGWSPLQSDTTITVEQARTYPIQVFSSELKKLALMEGDAWIGRPHLTPHPIGALSGLGAPIKLRQGPYNAIEPDTPLLREVVNRGIIADAKWNLAHDDCSCTFQLTYPIELDERHEVVLWDHDNQLHIGNPEHLLVQVRGTSSWVLELPESAPRPLVTAIAYNGVRLGACWENNWSSLLRRQDALDMKTVAALIRWFQLPVLSEQHLSRVRKLVQQAGSYILPVWLSDTPTEPSLHWTSGDEQWFATIRVIFKDWQPGDMAARRLVMQLGGMDENLDEPLLRTVWRLLRIDPLLMGKVLHMYVSNVYLPQYGTNATETLFRNLITTLAEAVNEQDIQRQEDALLLTISETMGYVDINFIRRGLLEPALQVFQKKHVKHLAENNIALALSVEPFRRLLSIRILKFIVRQVTTGRKDK
jgi:hypothetical protein